MERDPVRVLHIVGSMHPGGMENFIMNLYRNIDRSRVQFDFVVHMSGDADYEQEIQKMGGKLYTLPRLTRHPIANLKGLYRIVKDGHYKIVIRHTPNALVAPQVYAASRAGAFSICHSHNTTDPKKLLHHIGKLLMKHGKIGRFACSKEAGIWMFGKRECRVVHNAIDIDQFRFDREKRARIRKEFSLEDKHVYGHVGNFIQSKNHSFLLTVYQKIARLDDRAVFVCIGDGDLREQMQKEAERLGIGGRVIFTGIRHDVDAFLSAMDVLIFPSIFEGLPLTVVEAQASGLPCLISVAVDKGVEVTEGLISWKSIDETPQAWAEKAVSLVGSDGGDVSENRICQRENISEAGYDIQALAKWYEEYLIGEASPKIIFHIHNLSRGGAERVVINLSERFARDGYRVLIVTEETAQMEYDVPDGVERIVAGVDLGDAAKDGIAGIFFRLQKIRQRKKRLRSVLKKEMPDLVIAFGKSANYRAVPAAKGICPVLVSVRNDPKVDYAGRVNALFCRRYLDRADGCVFQTKEAQKFFSPKLQNKSRIILNPINEKYLRIEVPAVRRKVIVNVGRIAAQKNQALLLRAFADVTKRFPDYELHIYGSDTGDGTKETLDRITREEKLEEKVFFCGNSDNLEKEIADCALFVLSSDYEGLPNALMEAMAMGMPVIATDCPCGGAAMVIKDGVNGCLVPVGDCASMAAAMKKVLSEPEYAEKIGTQAAKIREIANGDRIYKQWKDYVMELTEE